MLAITLFVAHMLTQSSMAANKPVKKPTPDSPPAPAGKVLLDAWYTVKANGRVPFGYYNDRAELRGNRLFFQNHYWKKEEDYINEEQLGASAEATPELSPLFFNFHLTYRSSEITVDGTVTEGRKFSARVRKGMEELPIVKRTLPANTIFSSFFAIWLQAKSQAMKIGESAAFHALPEDSWDKDFAIETGRLKAEKPDEFATRTSGKRFSLEYRGLKSYWWTDDRGITTRIQLPDGLVEKVKNEEEARKFLE